ncbi:hypothetical protein [Rufibacter sp. XAAS-G3-1]|uniref:hypothetical protein n=1 Tax=Rufibacter sp. XAAS-G3-1 TaxID=2729134 RepID=UPI0015E6C897|nr:hypothetical protein [Rufibacter sp. XAAS-G3-1]
MTNITLLSYGDEKEHSRTALCILSFWSWYSGKKEDIRFLLYTDNTSHFEPYFEGIEVRYHLITPERWEDMLQGNQFKFFRKIAVIEDSFTAYPNDNLLFLDSDTFFIADPSPLVQGIMPGTSFMHLMDFTFQEGYPYATPKQNADFMKWLEGKSFQIGDDSYCFDKRNVSWNAGVLGMSSEIARYIPDVYRLTEEIFKATSFHVSEQLAFALVLQTVTKVHPSDTYILHYWPSKALPLSGLASKIGLQLSVLQFNTKLEITRKLTNYLQYLFKSTISFNSNNFSNGYKFAFKAFKFTLINKYSLINRVHLLKVVIYNSLKYLKVIKVHHPTLF